VVVIGVGNPYRRDDGVGPTVIERLRQRGLAGVTLAESDGEPTRLLDLWEGADLAIVVDAVRTDARRPGTIHRRSLHHPSVGGSGSASSHVMELGDSVALAAALDRLPGALLLLAVEVADASPGVGLSREVEASVPVVLDEITELLQARNDLPHPEGPANRGARDG
jgi:hydrogenase maturation protease